MEFESEQSMLIGKEVEEWFQWRAVLASPV